MGNHSPLSTLKPNVAYLQPDELGRNRKIREIITAALNDSAKVKQRLAEESAAEIAEAAQMIIAALRAGKKVFVFGNGGSAADAQHIVAELGGRFLLERSPLPAIALTTNTSMLTAIGNDYGQALIFSRQLEALASPGDVVIAISTSGRSANVLEALRTATEKQTTTIALCGQDGGDLARMVDLALIVPSDSTPRIQEAHITIGHILCELVERGLFGREDWSDIMKSCFPCWPKPC